MGDARQERRRGWQVGRGRRAAGSVNYDFDGVRRRCGGLLLFFFISPLSPSLLSWFAVWMGCHSRTAGGLFPCWLLAVIGWGGLSICGGSRPLAVSV